MLNKRLIVGVLAVVLLFLGIFSFAQSSNDPEVNGNPPTTEETDGKNKDDKNISDNTDTEETPTDNEVGTTQPTNNQVGPSQRVVSRDTTAPVITLNGLGEITLELNEEYKEEGATARDNRDGVVAVTISGNVNTNIAGIYEVTYTAIDRARNSSLIRRTVKVKPIIIAPENYQHELGTTHEPKKATVKVDQNENNNLLIAPEEDTVNINQKGKYTLTYNYSISDNVVALTKSTKVTVSDTQGPIIVFINNGSTIYAKNHSTKIEISDISGVRDNSQYMWIKNFATIPNWGAFDTEGSPIPVSNLIETPSGKTGIYHLCVRANDNSDRNNSTIECSEAFYLDNNGPTNFEFEPLRNETIEGSATQKYDISETRITAFDKEDNQEYSSNKPDMIRYVREYYNGYTDYNLTSVDLNRIGKYRLDYKLYDKLGNSNYSYKFIYVVDTTPPTIELNPNFTTVYEQGSIQPEWEDAITYTDNIKQDLTLDINTNNIDMNKLGIHTIAYTVTETEATNWDGSARVLLSSTYELNIEIVDPKPQGLIFFGKNDENQEDIGSAWETVKAQKGQFYEDWVYARSYDRFDNITYIVGADKECINGTSCYEIKYRFDKYDKTTSLITKDKVNLEEPGSYQIKYRVYDKTGHSNYRYRWVDVVDTTKPVITYNGQNKRTIFEYYEVNNNTGFTEESPFTVIDDIDGELKPFNTTFKYAPTWDKKSGTYSGTKTDKIDFAVPGVYRIDYFYKDKSNNDIYATRWIFIEDKTSPVITLLGVNPITLTVGDMYTDAGATAEDEEDGDITNKIVIKPTSIDTSVPGTYTITYNVSDKYGNSAEEVTRTIIVEHNDDFILHIVSYTITDKNDNKTKAVIQIDKDTTGYEFQYKWHTQDNIQGNSITNKLDLTNLEIEAGNKNETFLWIKATKEGTTESRIFLAIQATEL